MTYYLNSENGYINSLSTNCGLTEITKEEYEHILDVLKTKPTPTNGYDYLLKDDLTWELIEVVEDYTPTDEEYIEASKILLGVE